jgi:hypothetical protein
MSSRRDVIQSLVAGAVAVPALATAAQTDVPSSDPQAPWALIAPLKEGDELSLGWRIESLTPVERGASVLTLRHESGGHASVHLCLNNGQPLGIGASKHIDLVLMNGGKGDRPTEESIGRVVQALGRRIDENGGKLEGALTHHERVSRYGREALK